MILTLVLFGLLIISFIIIVYIFREHLKKESNESLIILMAICVAMIFLIPVILGITH